MSIANNNKLFGIYCDLFAGALVPSSLYGIKPSIQEKSCVVALGRAGRQLSFWFWLQAYPMLGQPCGGLPKLFSGAPCVGCLPLKCASWWQVMQDDLPGGTPWLNSTKELPS